MKWKKDESGFWLRLYKGEMVLESLKQFMIAHKIRSGSVSGIGACDEVVLGFYHLDEKRYEEKSLTGDYELVSLSGNLSWMESEPFAHCHVVLSGPKMECYGGHLVSARVSITVECRVEPKNSDLSRQFEADLGLNQWNF